MKIDHIINTMEGKPPLLTGNFCLISASNFFLFLSFYALMPLLPFYLMQKYSADGSVIGLVLSCYTVAAIVVRPIAGFLLDSFKRRPIYLIAYVGFALLFCGYIVASSLLIFIIVRITHGLMFGTATASGTTLVSQIIPKARMGEGLGIYGLANTLSMCLGPMLGLMAYHHLPFNTIFVAITATAIVGVIVASMVKIPPRTAIADSKITLDRFFIKSGVWASLTQILAYVPYGATVTYVAVYATEIGLGQYGGIYFTLMAVGLAVSRPLAGRKVDRGMLMPITAAGIMLSAVTSFSLSYASVLTGNSKIAVFLTLAFLQGITYGILNPSFNTIFVRLAPENRRGAATSMFLTSNDVGISIGMVIGGLVAQYYGGYYSIYRLGAILSLLAFALFIFKTKPSFQHSVG